MVQKVGQRLRELARQQVRRITQPSARLFDHPCTIKFQIKAVERLVVAERESISAAFERQRAEELARNDEAFEGNLATIDEKAGKLTSLIVSAY